MVFLRRSVGFSFRFTNRFFDTDSIDVDTSIDRGAQTRSNLEWRSQLFNVDPTTLNDSIAFFFTPPLLLPSPLFPIFLFLCPFGILHYLRKTVTRANHAQILYMFIVHFESGLIVVVTDGKAERDFSIHLL